VIKRTPQIRALMDHAIQLAIDLLESAHMPVVMRHEESPHDIAQALKLAKHRIVSPGPIVGKKDVLNDLQVAADYLSHRDVASLHTVIRPSIVAGNLRDIIRDLK